MEARLKSLSSPRVLLAAVAILLALSFIPVSGQPLLEVAITKAGAGQAHQAAAEYIRVQREQALKGFLVLSGLKVGLAILRSSEIGLILNVRIGDLAVAVYDYVNFGWKVLLAAVAWYYMAEYLLGLAWAVDIWFLWAALLGAAGALLLASFRPGSVRWRSAAGRLGATSGVIALILYLVLPLSFVGAGWVSAHITGSTVQEANGFLEQFRDGIPDLMEGSTRTSGIGTSSVTVPFPYDGSDPALALYEEGQVGGLGRILAAITSREKLRELRDYLEERSRALASAVLRQTAAYLFNIVLMPVLILASLYLGGKFLVSLLMGAPR